MLRFLLFVVVLFGGMQSVHAQGWATVRVGDTTWFMGGAHTPFSSSFCSPVINLLRVGFIDSARAFGADSAFYFARGVRGITNSTVCVDTAAPSWLGYRMLRTPAGEERYFNSVGDTLLLKPAAHLGNTWLLAKDTSNRTFYATVTAIGMDTVDGVYDSVKTATIQAYAGTAPIAHPYNSRVLQWSKTRGWKKSLDLFLFPNLPPALPCANCLGSELGSFLDSGQMFRIDQLPFKVGMKRLNLPHKYQPGNEWIWRQARTTPLGQDTKVTTTHDSVIAFQLLDSTHAIVTLHTKVADWEEVAPTAPPYQSVFVTSFSAQTHTDTVSALVSIDGFDQVPLLPEVKTSVLTMEWGAPWLIKPRYGVRPSCGGYVVSENQTRAGYFDFTNGCWRFMSTWDNFPRCLSVLTGFGLVQHTYPTQIAGGVGFYHQGGLTYLKLNGCSEGAKTILAPLSTDVVSQRISYVSIVPNPAATSARLENLPKGISRVTVRNSMGHEFWKADVDASTADLPTAHFPTGLYLVEISNATGRTTCKLQVIH